MKATMTTWAIPELVHGRRAVVLSFVVALAFPIPPAAAAERDAVPTVRVAGVVLKWVRGDKEANFRRAAPLIREAARGGARIVCTTECFLDGYAIADKGIPLDQYRNLGEPIPGGSYFRRLAALAAELKVHLVAGMLEADGDDRYNTAVLIAPDGTLAGKYRKQKLGHESARNTPGHAAPVIPTPYGRLGLMICADRTDPALVRRLRDGGAEFLLCPSGGMFGPKDNDPILQDRSRENRLPIVFVHPAEFLVTGPDGSVLDRTTLGDTLLVTADEVGKEKDRNRVFTFDLPVRPRPAFRILRTPGGVRFGLLGEKGTAPAPVLFLFANSIEDTLSQDAYVKVGRLLLPEGFLGVALDVPCHGEDRKKGEPEGLAGWRARLERGDDLVAPFARRASAVLDHLVKEGYADAGRVAACGTSRGGFLALHFAAAEPRVKCVAAFAPVTDLLALTEFRGMEKHAATKALALAGHADQLAGRSVWVCIGNQDQRVGTDHVIAFTRKLAGAPVARQEPADVELHVMPTAGHRINATAHDEAAAWILRRLQKGS
jgi:predicted amidohydrolase/dienelactone hydrolase